MLVFVTACTIGLIAALAFFGLGYVRLLGSNNEQKTAIEAAALAAARDLSLIAVNTDTTGTTAYGWLGLSDYAPNVAGTLPVSGDAWSTPVRSINTVIATIRLDLLIADGIGDANLKTIIKADYANALLAQQTLQDKLNTAIKPGNTATDVNGKTINVYADAEAAYKANQIRMTGSSNYVSNSLKLSLGCLTTGGATNIPIPGVGAGNATIPANATRGGYYLSYVDAPLDTVDFMLAGIGSNVSLVSNKLWAATTFHPAAQRRISCLHRQSGSRSTDEQLRKCQRLHRPCCRLCAAGQRTRSQTSTRRALFRLPRRHASGDAQAERHANR